MAERTLTVTHDGQRVDVVRHKPAYTHLLVPSSNPDQTDYDVVLDADGARCTCRGFLFRRTCRHSRLANGMNGQST